MIEKFSEQISIVFTQDGFTACNCILVEDNLTLLIDSAAGSVLQSVDPARINIILNSHHHYDHIGGNDLFPQAIKMAHPLEITAMQNPPKLSGTDAWHELMDEDCIMHAKEINGRPNRMTQPWHIDKTLRPGQMIDCGNTRIQVIHTPGHTAGHCSFYFPKEDLIFLGDVCLSKVGPWYGGSDSSVDDFIGTINTIREMRCGHIVTGHYRGMIEQNIDEVLVEYRDRILRREEKILDYVKEHPSTIHELADKHFIYAEHPNILVLFWEKSMLKKHLERLISLGEIRQVDASRFGDF